MAVAEPPWTTVRAGVLTVRAKSAGGDTRSQTLMARAVVMLVPETVRVKFPVVAVGLAPIVRVEVPGGVTGLLERVAVIPLGRPEAVRVTGDFSPLTEPTEIVMTDEEPWATLG